MMQLTRAQFETLQTRLREKLGAYWSIDFVDKKSPANGFDPPCNYVVCRMFGVVVQLCGDGQGNVQIADDFRHFEADTVNDLIEATIEKLQA